MGSGHVVPAHDLPSFRGDDTAARAPGLRAGLRAHDGVRHDERDGQLLSARQSRQRAGPRGVGGGAVGGHPFDLRPHELRHCQRRRLCRQKSFAALLLRDAGNSRKKLTRADVARRRDADGLPGASQHARLHGSRDRVRHRVGLGAAPSRAVPPLGGSGRRGSFSEASRLPPGRVFAAAAGRRARAVAVARDPVGLLLARRRGTSPATA